LRHCAVFEGDERELRLATRSESERDSWIERLHIAGFECLRIQLQSLREQLKTRTGHDPIKLGGLAVDGVGTADSVSGNYYCCYYYLNLLITVTLLASCLIKAQLFPAHHPAADDSLIYCTSHDLTADWSLASTHFVDSQYPFLTYNVFVGT